MKSSPKTRSTGGGNDNSLNYSCRENSMDSMKRQKYMTQIYEHLPHPGHKLSNMLYATWEGRRAITNSSRKNEATGPKWKRSSVVDDSGGESEIQCCKEQYHIGTWIFKAINQGKLDVVKQKMLRLNINIL